MFFEKKMRSVKNSIFRVHGRYRPLVTVGQCPAPSNISAIFYWMILCDALDDVARTPAHMFSVALINSPDL